MDYFKDCMTLEELRTKYKELVRNLHPDKNPDNPNAKDEFQEMQAQYEEREAELKGDYSKARKGRERRERAEREAKERKERERQEQARRKVEMAVEQARKNRQKTHSELKEGDYIYAKCVNKAATDMAKPWMEDVLRQSIKNGVNEECVVLIEKVFTMSDEEFFDGYLAEWFEGDIYGGYEVLQNADPTAGVRKGRRVAKVVMFKSEHYCAFGNPMGDQTISDYYLRPDYETMFNAQMDYYRADMARIEQEKVRIAAERKAKLLAEQAPLIEEWKDKLIVLSRGLIGKERETVAVNNLRTILKEKFPGTSFNARTTKTTSVYYDICWQDGPTNEEVQKVVDLFDPCIKYDGEKTPWQEMFGTLNISGYGRKMSTLAKARILQQLGQVSGAFRNSELTDEVPLSNFDWILLHTMAGVDVSTGTSDVASTIYRNGSHIVKVTDAIRFVFNHTSYYKPRRRQNERMKK